MKARVVVRLKAEVSDPEGNAVREALASMHCDAVVGVRVGKIFEIELSGSDPESARQQVAKIARDVLSNPVVETFEFELEPEARA